MKTRSASEGSKGAGCRQLQLSSTMPVQNKKRIGKASRKREAGCSSVLIMEGPMQVDSRRSSERTDPRVESAHTGKVGRPFLSILSSVVARIGAEIVVEPSFRIAGRITFKNGKSVLFRQKFFDINPLASLEVGRDKHATQFFLKQLGFKVPEELAFTSGQSRGKEDSKPRLPDALKFARTIGYPVIVKPNLLSRGILVTKVHSDEELTEAAAKVFQRDDIALVQRYYRLRDFRLVVLDDRVMNGYERIPLTVAGDGVSTMRELITARQLEIIQGKRDVDLEVDDFRIKANTARAGMSLDSVPARGQSIRLLDNANLSNGGRAIDMTGAIAPEFEKIAIDVTRKMNLRLCGVDLMAEDITKYSDNHVVLEINGAPGYANVGEVREDIIEELYFKVLRALEVGDTRHGFETSGASVTGDAPAPRSSKIAS